MRLFANGARSDICRPALHAGKVTAVKSPASIAAVGTKVRVSEGRRNLDAGQYRAALIPYRSVDLSSSLRPERDDANQRKEQCNRKSADDTLHDSPCGNYVVTGLFAEDGRWMDRRL